MNSGELTFREWIPEIAEHLTFILLSIKERRDISESDLDLLEYFHKAYYLGEVPFCKFKSEVSDEITAPT